MYACITLGLERKNARAITLFSRKFLRFSVQLFELIMSHHSGRFHVCLEGRTSIEIETRTTLDLTLVAWV